MNAKGDVLEEITIDYDNKGNITKKTKIINDPDSDEFGTATWTLVESQGDFPSGNNLRKTEKKVFIPHPEALHLKGSESTEKIDISGQKLTYWREELIDKKEKRESKRLLNKESRTMENEESVNSKIVSHSRLEYFDLEFKYLKQSHSKDEGYYDSKDGMRLDDETTTERLIRDQNGKITGYESTTKLKTYENTKDEKTQTYLPNPPLAHEYESTLKCTLIEQGEAKCEENLKVNNVPLPKLDSERKLMFVKYPTDPIFWGDEMSFFDAAFSFISFQGATEMEMVSGETYYRYWYSFPSFGYDHGECKFKIAKEYDSRFGFVKEVTEEIPLKDPNKPTQITKKEMKFDEKTGFLLEDRFQFGDHIREDIYSY